MRVRDRVRTVRATLSSCVTLRRVWRPGGSPARSRRAPENPPVPNSHGQATKPFCPLIMRHAGNSDVLSAFHWTVGSQTFCHDANRNIFLPATWRELSDGKIAGRARPGGASLGPRTVATETTSAWHGAPRAAWGVRTVRYQRGTRF